MAAQSLAERRARPPFGLVVSMLATVMPLLAACVDDPVVWQEPALLRRGAAGDPSAVASRTVPASLPPVPGPACAASPRVVPLRGGAAVAVWWVPRADSSVALVAARAERAGGAWGNIVPVDTVDRSVIGCRRPAPAVAADTVRGYVHVTYSLLGPEGPGVFFSHSMDDGRMFHAPVPIVYGERPASTSVAASDDLVVVAYEDPNAVRPTIGLAISRTMGHIFEERVPDAAPLGGVAPRVAVHGRRVTLTWARTPADSATTRLVREGALP